MLAFRCESHFIHLPHLTEAEHVQFNGSCCPKLYSRLSINWDRIIQDDPKKNSRVTWGSEETRNFEECPEIDEENLVTHQKLSHGDALVHTEALLNYLEQEDESSPAEKNYIEKSA
ncbi:hypothetical protein AVEN_97747-1 [Araneus ventricosus]|uniref:Uncharacterized protein n=1 Tax=Araneus ventricosus TaxID=182803 RepID=A0A4Y2E4U7_ARAVE|nr:hypothetical protein AVEN_97747-1 [Araneus ventricosus]